jgi:dolichyl-diphosphooligosaccharide--protein glycosyltransferase
MVCLAASALASPGLGEGAIDVWQWFGRDERFQALVSESQPLFWLRDRFTLEVAAGRLSNFVFVAPLAWIAAGLAWRRKANPAPRFFFLAWVAALLIATLVQKRFFNSSSVGLALLFGWSLAAVGRWLAARPAWRERPGPRRLVLAGLAAALLWPTVAGYRQPLENWLRDGDALMGSANQIEQRVAIEMARYLEATSEPTSGWLDSRARPEYAVLAPWPLGHVLEYVARRPTVTDAFGDDIGVENFESALRYYASSESDALSIADRLSVRYVVAQRSHAFLGQRPAPDSILAAMFGRDGSEGRTAPHALRALARHRLVYESAPLGRRAAELESVFKLYEIVPGAVLIGRTTPRAWVRARLELATNRKRSFVYATRVRADADGVYRLRVPYANEGQPGFFELGAEYFVSCGGEEAGVVVTEDDVQAGRSVASPELACAARPAVA